MATSLYVDRVLGRAALEGGELRFVIKLKKKTSKPTTLSFAWTSPPNPYSRAALDRRVNGSDIGTPTLSNGARFGANGTLIVAPAGVTEFTLSIPIKKDYKSEAPEFIGVSVDGVKEQTAVSSDLPYDPKRWWRTESWFLNQIFDSSGAPSKWLKIWLDPKNVGLATVANPLGGPNIDLATFVRSYIGYDPKAHQTTFRLQRPNFNSAPWTQTCFALVSVLQSWYSGNVKYASNAPKSVKPTVKAQINPNSVVITDLRSGKAVQTLVRPTIVQRPNRNQAIILGDSITDEDLGNGTWVTSLRADVEPEWDVLNLATGSMGTSGFRFNDADLGAVNLLKNQLLVNPTPGAVLVNIGWNNNWRGLTASRTEQDLDWIVRTSLNSGAKVVLSHNLVFLPNKWPKSEYDSYVRAFTNIAKKYSQNRNFSYIKDFYKPVENIPNALFPDKIHSRPIKKVSDALYSSFRSAMSGFPVHGISAFVLKTPVVAEGGTLKYSVTSVSRGYYELNWSGSTAKFQTGDFLRCTVISGSGRGDVTWGNGKNGTTTGKLYLNVTQVGTLTLNFLTKVESPAERTESVQLSLDGARAAIARITNVPAVLKSAVSEDRVDSLFGGDGDDFYQFLIGSGSVEIDDEDFGANGVDVLSIEGDASTDQLWFRKVGSDLRMDIIGTSDSATIKNWYLGDRYKVEEFRTSDGKTLYSTDIDKLVQAMAAFTPPSAGQTTLPPNYQTTLAPVLTANWK